jgi:addiction module HigA family antidote
MEPIKNGLPPVHPGEFIREAMTDLGITQAELARKLGVSPMRISHLVNEVRPVTADLALRLGKAFGQSAQYWLSLQASYDLKIAQASMAEELDAILPLAA